MKRAALIALAVVLVVAVALAFILPGFINPERYRPRIEQLLSGMTGRKVTIGPMRLRVFPLPEVSADGFSVGEDPASGAEPFLTAARVDARVRLLPLLSGKLDIVSFDVDRPTAHLKRSASGQWNLLSLMKQAGASSTPAAPQTTGGGGFAVVIERFRLMDGTVDVADAGVVPGKTITLDARKIDLTLSDFSTASAMGIKLALDLAGSGHVTIDGKLGPLPAQETSWPIDAHVTVKGFGSGPAGPYLTHYGGVTLAGGSLDLDATVKGTAPKDLSVSGRVDLKALKLTRSMPPLDGSVDVDAALTPSETKLRKAVVRAGKAAVTLSGAITDLSGKPKADLRAVASKVAFKDVAPILGMFGSVVPAGLGGQGEISIDARAAGPIDDPMAMAIDGTAEIRGFELSDPSLKQPVKDIAASLTLKDGRAELKSFQAALGRSRVQGSAAVSRFAHPVIDVDLTVPLLDVDEILSFLPASGGAPQPASSGNAGASMIRDVTVRGRLSVNEARAMNLKLTGAKATLDVADGRAHLSGVSASLYGGGLTGDVTAGLVETGPPFTLDAKLHGIDFNGLCADFSKDLGGLIHGTFEGAMSVKGRGLDTQGLREHLTGNASIALRDGKLTSFGFIKQLSAALTAVGGRGIGQDETPFKALTGTFDIKDGRATTQDLKLDSPDLVINGKGSIGLDLSLAMGVGVVLSEPVSADMVAKTDRLRALMNGKGQLALDLKLGGTLQKPSIGLDPDMLKHAAEDTLKKKGSDLFKKLLKR